MRSIHILFSVFCLLLFSCNPPQPLVEKLQLPKDHSIRAVKTTKTSIWLSGSEGAVYSKELGQMQWQDKSPIGYDSLDFRSMEVVNDSVVLVASATNPAIVLRSVDNGASWNKVYQDTASQAFFDAMKMDSTGLGFILGDPQDGVFSIYASQDYGKSWKKLSNADSPIAADGEVAFAAANSSMIQIKNGILFVTGGKSGAYIHAGVPLDGSWKKELLGMYSSEACGAFNICRKGDDIMIAGGCYDQVERSKENMLFSDNMGLQWFSLPTGPKGYVSGMAFVGKKFLISAGDLGIQWAPSKTRNFSLLPGTEKMNVVACNEQYCVAAGKDGRVFKITFN